MSLAIARSWVLNLSYESTAHFDGNAGLMARTRQIAALPMRLDATGAVEVLLVTSRETRRWVIPKGWPWRGRPDYEAAAGEAWEEAGVRGSPESRPVGSYTYEKRRPDDSIPVTVDVYVLEVTEEVGDWPEAGERNRAWFSPRDAAEVVQEPELKVLLLSLVR